MTNVQEEGVDVTPSPELTPTKAPVREGACMSHGGACSDAIDCCSQWCVNGACATRLQ